MCKKDWNESCGGMLRIIPTAGGHQFHAPPILGPLALSCSNRRNPPHEVRPSFSARLAITDWYYDVPCYDANANEKKEDDAKLLRAKRRQVSILNSIFIFTSFATFLIWSCIIFKIPGALALAAKPSD